MYLAALLLSPPVVSPDSYRVPCAFSNSVGHNASVITSIAVAFKRRINKASSLPDFQVGTISNKMRDFESDDKNYGTYKSATQPMLNSSSQIGK
jgi:hypothetical protein